jgi:hypothetical protein
MRLNTRSAELSEITLHRSFNDSPVREGRALAISSMKLHKCAAECSSGPNPNTRRLTENEVKFPASPAGGVVVEFADFHAA